MSGSRKVTLAEVAASAGVSTTTASYILNGRSAQMRISADTERRVREAVATLGYRPNRNARSLRTAKTSTVGVITDFVASGMFASAMLAGANAAARQADLLLVIGESEGDVAVRDRLIDEMLDRQVDGILYVTRTALRTPLPAKLRGAQTVMLNCFDPEGSAPAVLADERSGGRTAAEVLLRAGIDSDVFIVGEDPEPLAIAGPLRLQGVRERLGEAGAEVAGIVPCEWGVETAYVATQDWLGAGHVPRGLICMNDRVAMGAYEALAESGLAVPDQVSVVSFDGSDLALWLRPHLTSVSLPFREMGALAVQLLLDPHRPSGTRLVPMELLAGSSVRGKVATARA
ncbi:MAG: LacI family DNA-binding transcriptional regulator [Nocardioides sp.]